MTNYRAKVRGGRNVNVKISPGPLMLSRLSACLRMAVPVTDPLRGEKKPLHYCRGSVLGVVEETRGIPD